MKQFLIIAVIFLIIEYYSFIALKTTIRNLNQGFHISFYIAYVILTLGIFLSIYFLFHWRSDPWPSNIMKLTVNFFIGLFLGKVLITTVMMIGDVFVALKWIFNYLISFVGGRSELTKDGAHVISRSQFISQTALLLGGLLASGLAYGMTNRYRYKIRRSRVPLEGLPKAFKGLRIAQISDIHAGSFDDAEAVSAGVNAIMREKPDLILFTGDLVNNLATEILPYIDVFKELKAPLGVYSILGNHDYGDYVHWPSDEAKRNNLGQLKQYHADLGWRLLMNEHVILERDQEKIVLVGVENWGARAFTKYGNLKKAMTGLESALVKILMSHDPSHWDAEVRKDYPDIALTLSGHTHGMQFGIEIPGFKWSPVQYMYKQWAGLYQEGHQYLYVNRGYGFIGYQGRLGILPEITILELT
ncbi:MAG: metallophosphoesterase [Mangrovibacterium sp.]